jgi:hypothetical protein
MIPEAVDIASSVLLGAILSKFYHLHNRWSCFSLWGTHCVTLDQGFIES